MPYVICAECELTTYSAALWSSTEECPKCGAPLPVGSRAVAVSLARDGGLLRSTEARAERSGRWAPMRTSTPRGPIPLGRQPTTARVLAAIRHLARST